MSLPPIVFFAAGVPKGQPRPKAFTRGGIASVYDPGTAEGWKGCVALAARPFLPSEPMEGPVYLRLDFYAPRPGAHFRGKSRDLRPTAPEYHTGKPDADNFAKAIMDALTVLRMWRDDSQVADLRVRKLYEDDRGPGCEITIREATEL